jgi:hypothetical protein
MTSEELVDESNATEPWELNAIIPNPELYALGNLYFLLLLQVLAWKNDILARKSFNCCCKLQGLRSEDFKW